MENKDVLLLLVGIVLGVSIMFTIGNSSDQTATSAYSTKKHAEAGQTAVLRYDPSLLPWQVTTDPEFISGGTIRIGYNFLDVVKTQSGLDNVILIGDETYKDQDKIVKLDEVIENAVG